jgi:hypothetical protein
MSLSQSFGMSSAVEAEDRPVTLVDLEAEDRHMCDVNPNQMQLYSTVLQYNVLEYCSGYCTVPEYLLCL